MSNPADKSGPPILSVPKEPAGVHGPPGLGDLNYLQSLLAGITNQELNTTSSPTYVGLTLSGLTASLPVVTNASKALASVSYATLKASLAIAQADVSGLTTGASPTFAGLTLTVGAGAAKVWTSDAGGVGSWATPAAPAAHVLDGALHTVSGLTGGHFLKALSATTFGFAAHGLTYTDVGAEASGAVAAHAALITGVHGLVFTAGKALTLTESLTLNALPVGGLAVATAANVLGSLAVGLTTQVLVGGGAATVPAWSADLPTGVTIGSGYIYRAGGTDIAVADGGTNLSSYAVGDILYASGTTTIGKLAGVAAGQPLLSGGVTTAPAYAGYTFSGTAAQTYTFPSTSKTLLATTGSPAALVIASQATGDLLYASSATAWSRLALGAAGKALVVNAGGTLPEWGTVLTNPMDAAGQLIYGGAAGAPTKLAAGATTDILVGGGAAAPVWTAATGTGAPVRAGSPTFTTQITITNAASHAYQFINGANGYESGIIFQNAGASKWELYKNSADDFALYDYASTAGVRVFVQKSTGYVGLGTVVPTAMLAIKGGGDTWTSSGWSRGIQNAQDNAIKWVKGTNIAWGLAQTGDNLYFIKSAADDSSAAAAYPLFLKGSNGYVGIGTTAPGSKLAVVGLPASAAGLSTGDFYYLDIGGLKYLFVV